MNKSIFATESGFKISAADKIPSPHGLKFSVAICVYKNDKPEWFELALKSIIDQTVKPDEIVLVVDGPVSDELENTIRKCESRSPDLLKVTRLQKNVGLGRALKIAMEKSKNEIIARMDSDDVAVSTRFEKQLECFESDSELSIVGGQIHEFIDTLENVVGIRDVPFCDSEIKEYLKSRCPFNHVTVMFKKSEATKAGGYLDWHSNEDYYLWIRMFLSGCKFRNLSDNLVNVRVGKDMYARRGDWKYFISEAKLQKLMLKNNIISFPRCFFNTAIRLLVQVIITDNLRAFLFKNAFRKNMNRLK